jgi:hypothetical protein
MSVFRRCIAHPGLAFVAIKNFFYELGKTFIGTPLWLLLLNDPGYKG